MTQSEQKTKRLSGHSGPVGCLSFSLDGSVLASGGDDGKVLLWQLAELEGEDGEDDDEEEDAADAPTVIKHKGKVTEVRFLVPPLGMVNQVVLLLKLLGKLLLLILLLFHTGARQA